MMMMSVLINSWLNIFGYKIPSKEKENRQSESINDLYLCKMELVTKEWSFSMTKQVLFSPPGSPPVL